MTITQPDSYLEAIHSGKRLSVRRRNFLDFLGANRDWFGDSIVEVGAGAPDFLVRAPFSAKTAIDVDDYYRKEFEKEDIRFLVLDLNDAQPAGLGPFDVAICSDVFEHLLWPSKALETLAAWLGEGGVLLSHVPNEFRLKKTLKVMFGMSEGIGFHKGMREWNDPHLRRFTDRGYRCFLETCFRNNYRLSALYPSGQQKRFRLVGLEAPFCLQPGPTYLSTNDDGLARKFAEKYARHRRYF